MGKPAKNTTPTLRKLGADLRWLIEKSGVNPESATLVTIGVADGVAQQKVLDTFKREYDPAVMRLVAANIFTIHGVYICVTITPQVATLNTYNKPIEPA